MGIMDVLDRGFGAIAGVFVGLLMPFTQIVYAYVLFYESMRRAKFNGFVNLLATLTIGTVAALLTAFTSLLLLPLAPIYGMIVGFREGLFNEAADGSVSGSLNLLTNCIDERFDKQLIFAFTDSDTFAWDSDRSVGVWIMQYLILGSFSFIEILQTAFKFKGVDYQEIENHKYDRYQRREDILREREANLRNRTVLDQAHMILGTGNYAAHAGQNPVNNNLIADVNARRARFQAADAVVRKAREILSRVGDRIDLMTPEENIIVQAARRVTAPPNRENGAENATPQQIRDSNAKLLSSFDSPQDSKNGHADLLTEAEIKAFKEKIKPMKDENECKKLEGELKEYVDATQCPITGEPIEDPVTVVEGKGAAPRVYENSALRRWIDQQNSGFDPVEATDPKSRTPLNKLEIKNGYPDFVAAFVTYVREFLKPTVTTPAPAISSKVDKDKIRDARLKLFDKQQSTSSSPEDDASSTNKSKPAGRAG